MGIELSEQYRKIGNHLYQKQGSAFIHCAVLPPRIKILKAAVRWFEAE